MAFRLRGYRRYRRRYPLRRLVRRRRVTRLRDPSATYRVQTRTAVKHGRKVAPVTRTMRVLKTVTEPVRTRFGNIADITATTGPYWLNQDWHSGTIGVNQVVRMPVYMLNLFAVSQGGNPPVGDTIGGAPGYNTLQYAKPFFELYRTDGGQYSWGPVPGIDPTDGTTKTFINRRVAPSKPDAPIIGRKGHLDWTRVRMSIWGKKSLPTDICVRLVRWTEDDFCPEAMSYVPNTGFTASMTNRVQEFWEHQLKYLLNGPTAAQPRTDTTKYMQVLKEYRIQIDPVDAAAQAAPGDPRVHIRTLDIFNRWNRVIDFTQKELNAVGTDVVANLRNQNLVSSAASSYTAFLREPKHAVYLLIDSVQPLPSEGDSADPSYPRQTPQSGNQVLSASFDLNFEANWTVVDLAAGVIPPL